MLQTMLLLTGPAILSLTILKASEVDVESYGHVMQNRAHTATSRITTGSRLLAI